MLKSGKMEEIIQMVIELEKVDDTTDLMRLMSQRSGMASFIDCNIQIG
jgi:hypothetical protein